MSMWLPKDYDKPRPAALPGVPWPSIYNGEPPHVYVTTTPDGRITYVPAVAPRPRLSACVAMAVCCAGPWGFCAD
jgi:hypothetical protein